MTPYTESYGHGVKWSRGPLIGGVNSSPVFLAVLKPDLDDDDDHELRQKMAVKSTKDSENSLRAEELLLETFQGCPYIVQCFGQEVTFGNTGDTVYNLLLEYGDGGTLASLISRNCEKGTKEEQVRSIAKCIIKCLIRIHANGYMLRNLSPKRIILVATSKPVDEPENDCCTNNDNMDEDTTPLENKTNITTNNSYIAKICDFGVAKVNKLTKMNTHLEGNIRYLPPESAFSNKQWQAGDIWALGVIVHEMLTGRNMWGNASNSEIATVLVNMGRDIDEYGIKMGKVSKSALSFVEDCFATPKCRFTAKMLLDHEFIKGV